jgi:glyoxylase-like metal-dependent hydrolase (beta-lactamase superfamily II)
LGDYPDAWISGGPACGVEPEFQVHALNDDTVILRQSLCTSFEAPFLFILFGEDKALLLDTGAGGVDVVGAVMDVVETREAEVGRDLELVVVNSHAHGDHTQGNASFAKEPGVKVVGPFASQVIDFLDMPSFESSVGKIDLGGREVELLGIPGHEDNAIALYDQQHGILLTGDSFYPGRLFIDDFADYKTSISRLIEFSSDREVCAILGTHIEMSKTPGDDYDFGATHHPNERDLQLSMTHLLELQDALDAMGATAVREVHDDFVIFPL